MADLIRKISVGPDYKNSMTYTCGASVLSGEYNVRSISRDDQGEISVYIINGINEIFLWKTFTSSIPVHIEYNINF
jgi:hypothetical protein